MCIYSSNVGTQYWNSDSKVSTLHHVDESCVNISYISHLNINMMYHNCVGVTQMLELWVCTNKIMNGKRWCAVWWRQKRLVWWCGSDVRKKRSPPSPPIQASRVWALFGSPFTHTRKTLLSVNSGRADTAVKGKHRRLRPARTSLLVI